jgi:hypothetical protein
MDKASAIWPIDWPLSAEGQKWHDVLTQFRDHLRQICQSELVAADRQAQRIITSMFRCRCMAEIDAQMSRLIMRYGELLAAKTGDKTEFNRLVNRSRPRGRAAFAGNGKRHNFAAADGASRRTYLKF